MIKYRGPNGRFISREKYLESENATAVDVRYPWENRIAERQEELEVINDSDDVDELESFDYELGEGEY